MFKYVQSSCELFRLCKQSMCKEQKMRPCTERDGELPDQEWKNKIWELRLKMTQTSAAKNWPNMWKLGCSWHPFGHEAGTISLEARTSECTQMQTFTCDLFAWCVVCVSCFFPHHFNKVGDFFSSKSENHEHEAGIGRREGREVQWTDVSQNRKRTQSKALCATCMRTRSPVLCLMGLLVVSFPGIFWMWRGMSCARNTLGIVSAAKGRARPHTFHDISLGRFQRFHRFQCQETLSRFEEQARFAQQLLAQCARRKSQNVSKPRKHDISIKHAQSTTQRLTKHSIGQYQCTKGTGTCCYMLFHAVPPVEFEDSWRK